MDGAFVDSSYGEARLRKLLSFQNNSTFSEDIQATLVEELFRACKSHRTAFKGGSLCQIYHKEWPDFLDSLAASEGADDFEDLPASLRMKAFVQLLVYSIARSGDDKETISLKDIVARTERRYTSDKVLKSSTNTPRQITVLKQNHHRYEVCSWYHLIWILLLNQSTRGDSHHGSESSGGRWGGDSKAMRSDDRRPAVGASAEDKLRFIRAKAQKWQTSQLLHEFSGPNASNFESIVKCDDVRVTGEVLKLLSSVHEDSTAGPLFRHLMAAESMKALSSYVRNGPLSNDEINTLALGRGSKKWMEAVTAAKELFLVLTALFRHVPEAMVESTLCDQVEILQNRLKNLCPPCPENEDGDSDEIVDYMQTWDATCSSTEAQLLCALEARHMHDLISSVVDKQNSGRRIIRDKRKAEEERREQLAEERKARGGMEFMNDPAHDSDFMSISVVPLQSELLSTKRELLPQNLVVRGKLSSRRDEDDDDRDCSFHEYEQSDAVVPSRFQYRSFHHYLNTHFLLLREDCLAELRRGIQAFRERLAAVKTAKPELDSASILQKAAIDSKHCRDNTSFNVYLDVAVTTVDDSSRQGLGFVVEFRLPDKTRVDWTKSSRFKNGNLLCLSRDGSFDENSILLAMVLKSVNMPESIPKLWNPTITISVDAALISRFDLNASYTMIESPVFFDAYRPVLKALQHLGNSGTHFDDILTGKMIRIDPPQYLVDAIKRRTSTTSGSFDPRTAGWDMSSVFPNFPANENGVKVWNPLQSQGKLADFPSDPRLDKSQRDAIACALSKKLALIQGPPGCGKTFIGVLLTRILLANRDLRSRAPILFVCQTNHALDQILEHVYKYEPNIIRIGSRSESPVMRKLTIEAAKERRRDEGRRNVSRTTTEAENFGRLKSSLRKLKCEIAQLLRPSSKGSKLNLRNCHLARLWKILKEVHLERIIEDIIERAPLEAHENALKSVVKGFRSSRKDANLPEYLCDLSSWISLSTKRKLIIMATFVSNDEESDSFLSDLQRASGAKNKCTLLY